MAVKKRVFASKAERDNYYKLSRQWAEKYRLWHNLPFLQVFERKPLFDFSNWALRPIDLTDVEFNRLKKTSIDYTLCTQDDEPLVCIEFDGLQDGFNVGTKYVSNLNPSYPWRDEFLSLKLKVAHGSLFPFFVLGSRYFNDISHEVKLMMVDGIIGEVLAKRAASERFADGFKPEDTGISQADFDMLDPYMQDELVTDWATGVEVESDMENNPVYTAAWKLGQELGIYGGATEFLHYPSADAARSEKERKRLIDEAIMNGVRCVITTDDVGTVTREAWLPNFQTPGFLGFGLLEEMAQLMALDVVRQRRQRKAPR